MINLSEIKNNLNSCSSVEQINVLKKETMEKIDREHTEKMNKFNEIKARHDEELDTISKEIKEAIDSKDFVKVQVLLKKQTELIEKQSIEILSVM